MSTRIVLPGACSDVRLGSAPNLLAELGACAAAGSPVTCSCDREYRLLLACPGACAVVNTACYSHVRAHVLCSVPIPAWGGTVEPCTFISRLYMTGGHPVIVCSHCMERCLECTESDPTVL